MVEFKDIEKEEVKKKTEEVKKEEQTKKSFKLSNVPILVVVGGLIILFIKYQSVVKAGGKFADMTLWFLGYAVIIYLIGIMGSQKESTILTPEEAEFALKKELNRKVKNGQIDKWADIYIGPNNGLFFHEALPQHYQIELEISGEDYKHYKRAIVFAEGPTKGYVTIQDSVGKLTGRDVIPTVSIIPRWLKESKTHGLDLDKFLLGTKK